MMLTERKAWLGLLARVPADWLEDMWPQVAPEPGHRMLRPAEIGSVMLRGRTGGTGEPFNLGEMTVTRCALQLDDGTVGHGHVQGRDRERARRVALLDALLQGPRGAALQAAVIAPLAARMAAAAEARARKAAATKVEFFTLVRGED